MASRPTRRPDAQRVRHLDAHIQPVEDACLSRAMAIEEEARQAPVSLTMGPDDVAVAMRIASEFRKLADELHYW